MALTYVLANLASNPLYQVRLLIGDTDTNAPAQKCLDDAEITWRLNFEGVGSGNNAALLYAAADCCEDLAAKFARKEVGTTSHQDDKRYDMLRAQARLLRERAAAGATWFAGGISESDKDLSNSDPDRIRESFGRGMMDNPNTDQTPLDEAAQSDLGLSPQG